VDDLREHARQGAPIGAQTNGRLDGLAGTGSEVSRRQPQSKRLRTAARWPLGVALTGWRYLWRLTPIERWEWAGSLPEDAGPPLPDGIEREDLQPPDDGAGPLVHRLYRARMRTSTLTPEQLMTRLARDLDAVAPSEFASFQKLAGDAGELRVGDEYVVRMPGPWDGPVRVVDRTPTSFRLATLSGHLEAGQIEFRARAGDGLLEFTIESWARSGDRLSNLIYTHLRFSKEVQLHMWTSVLERVVELAGAKRHGPLAILTRRVDVDREPQPPSEVLVGPRDARTRRRFEALADKPLNFDVDAEHTTESGWHVDEVIRELVAERSGPPRAGGVWETARRLMIDYQVADPDIVRATYRRDAPLAGRDMLLQVRFAGVLRFYVGVRIGGDYDETRTIDGREVRVFGWDYSTLEGHFEQGRLHYEVWKWLDTGVVEFRLRAYSKMAGSGPLALRLGYRIFGRSRQLAFYRQAARRVAGLTSTQLELQRDVSPAPDGRDVRPRREFAVPRR
jgi:uncharacterized protein (UPF0548 family)